MRWLTISVAITAFALVGAGCGGDEESTGDTDTVVITDTSATDETTTEETTTDETETETETDISGGLASGDCLELINASAALSQALAAAGTSGDLDESSKFFDEFADKAPEEIRADFQILAEAYAVYIAAAQDIGLGSGETPSAEQLAQYQQALAAIDQQELSEASTRISAWSTANCPGG